MEITTIILSTSLLVSNLIVWRIQEQRIKSLKEMIDILKRDYEMHTKIIESKIFKKEKSSLQRSRH